MESIDQHSTVDAFSTHDPDSEGIKISIDLFSNVLFLCSIFFPAANKNGALKQINQSDLKARTQIIQKSHYFVP